MAKTVETRPQATQCLGDHLHVNNVEDVQYRRVGAGLRRQWGGEAPPRTLADSLPNDLKLDCAVGAETADPASEWQAAYPDVEGDAGPFGRWFPLRLAKPAGSGIIFSPMGRKKTRRSARLDPVRKRLLRLLEAKGSNLLTASVAMGRNDAYLQQFVYRGTPKVLAEDDREILAEHLGCRPELLKHGRSFRLSTNATRPSPPDDAYAAPIGYSAVPEADLREEPYAEEAWNGELRETGDAWTFADSFIRHRLRADPGDLWMVEVDGDSMEPLLSSGDHIMIDVSRTVPAPPGIFVIWDGIALVAKRIEHVAHSDPARVVLQSLNPEYDGHECAAEEVRVVGRAVWMSRLL